MRKPDKIEELQGRVIAQRVLQGTASEHTGVVIETDAGEHLRLQRAGANPFADPVTRGLVGHIVRVTGIRLGNVFRFTDFLLD
jgi:hypothetical protein